MPMHYVPLSLIGKLGFDVREDVPIVANMPEMQSDYAD
jgi:hypothetical protein